MGIEQLCAIRSRPADSCRVILTKYALQPCKSFPICSTLNNNGYGDLTLVQVNEEYPKFKIDQIIEIREKLMEIFPRNKTPLISFKDVFSKGVYIIPDTNICVWQGRKGRGNTCPNNPVLNPEQHRPDICTKCLIYPSIAASTKKELPHIYEIIRQQRLFDSEKKS